MPALRASFGRMMCLGYIIPHISRIKNQIMIRKILKAFLLMTFTVTAGLSSIGHAQQHTTVLTGEWVGDIDSPGRSEFARLSLTENAGEMRRPLNAKLSLVQHEGDRVRFELSSLKLVMTGTIAGD